MTSDSKAVCGGGEDPFSVERIARLICEASGQNPDQCVHGSGIVTYGGDGKQAYTESKCYRRAWENHISPANAVIARYAALASTAGAGAGDWQPTDKIMEISRKRLRDIQQAWADHHDLDEGNISFLLRMAGRYLREAPAVPASPRSGAETASPPAPVEHGVEIMAISEHQLRELSALADWLERDSSENDADNIRAAVSALSQGGGAGRSEKGEGEDLDRLRYLAQSRYELLRECQSEFRALGCKGLVETIETALSHPLAKRAAPAQSPSTSDREG